MQPVQIEDASTSTGEPGFVSGRFVSNFLGAMDRDGIPTTELLGDLPIDVGDSGRVARPVEWAVFADFLKRLEHHLGGPDALEACGEKICVSEPSAILGNLAGFSTSPYSLYRAATQWALRRSLPGLETRIEQVEPNLLEIRARLVDGLRPCSALFYLATGAARALPRTLGMCNAVVSAEIGDFEARFQITVPPSRTIWARLTRTFRSVFSAGSVLQVLETQQLELHAKHAALQKTNAALAESERRYRAITDAAVDVLCEIDENGRIIYVSASVEDLMGYSPEQVTGSHFSLWVPTAYRGHAKERFETLASQSIERAISLERVRLHTESGEMITAEISIRSYRTPEGDVRMVGILRDDTNRPRRRAKTADRTESWNDRSTVDALRSRVEDLRDSPSTRPIERSLSILLTALEFEPTSRSPGVANRFVTATDRMTQIVESAMALAPDPSSQFGWLETKKLVERVRLGFLARECTSELRLRIDATSAPPLVWGEEALFTTALGSLLEWAAERCASEVELRIETARSPSNGQACVVFSVAASRSVDSGANAVAADDDGIGNVDPSADLAIAIAEDAIEALGGDLAVSSDDIHRRQAAGRLRLPQPAGPS